MGLLVRLEVDRGVDQGLLVLALPEPRHRLPERRVGLDLVDVEAPRLFSGASSTELRSRASHFGYVETKRLVI